MIEGALVHGDRRVQFGALGKDIVLLWPLTSTTVSQLKTCKASCIVVQEAKSSSSKCQYFKLLTLIDPLNILVGFDCTIVMQSFSIVRFGNCVQQNGCLYILPQL